jgi:hypothetical protein
MLPELSRLTHAMSFSSVHLPQPERPTMAMEWPEGTHVDFLEGRDFVLTLRDCGFDVFEFEHGEVLPGLRARCNHGNESQSTPFDSTSPFHKLLLAPQAATPDIASFALIRRTSCPDRP